MINIQNFKRTSFNQHYTLTSTCQSRSFYLVSIPCLQHLFDIYRVFWYDLHMMSYLSPSVRHSTTVSNLYYIHILNGSYVSVTCFFIQKKKRSNTASHSSINPVGCCRFAQHSHYQRSTSMVSLCFISLRSI